MGKCVANYKNLNEIQSYSEQGYATVQWANQNCENDEYLKQKTDELNYLTPPAVRKNFSPILLDQNNSFGCQINPDGTVSFNTATQEGILINFDDFSMIDVNKSTCVFESIPIKESDEIVGATKRAAVPLTSTSSKSYATNYTQGDGIGSYWYVGYDHAKNYEVRPDWIKNPYDGEIPSIVRAQTFVIPQDENGQDITKGMLESVDLFIDTSGAGKSNWASPLYVRLWKVQKKTYDNEVIYEPIGGPGNVLASAEYQPNFTTPHLQNFFFDKAVEVNTGEHYAIVVFSPLSHKDNCPRIGGWNRDCMRGAKYPDGDAFLSTNNATSFTRYGRDDEYLDSKYGKFTPQDFAFVAHIRRYSQVRVANKDFYLYLKPIQTNPVKKVTIMSIGQGNEQSNNFTLDFEVSQDGKNWVPLGSNFSVSFNQDNDGEYPHIIFIRCKMKTTTSSDTPYLERILIDLSLDDPSELYARTHFYSPKLSPMLGANVWGRVFAPFTCEPQVTGSVEIIQEEIRKEHFQIVTAQELEEYVYTDENGVLKPLFEGLDVEKITDDDLSVRYEYLMENRDVIEILRNHNVYVKPYTYLDDGDSVTDLLSFEEGLKFVNSPAYPIREAILYPRGNSSVVSYSEWLDFKFDYDNDLLKFYQDNVKNVVDELPVGQLDVSYNPIFIQGLSANEVGVRDDDEGLILDYFKEKIVVSEDMLIDGIIPLRVGPVNPIREVILNDMVLRENIDFMVDYVNHCLIFPFDDLEHHTILHYNDELQVVYTPNLEDPSIAIGYRAKRELKTKDICIEANYIEYKV